MDELLHMLGRHQRESLGSPGETPHGSQHGSPMQLEGLDREALLDEVFAQLDADEREGEGERSSQRDVGAEGEGTRQRDVGDEGEGTRQRDVGVEDEGTRQRDVGDEGEGTRQRDVGADDGVVVELHAARELRAGGEPSGAATEDRPVDRTRLVLLASIAAVAAALVLVWRLSGSVEDGTQLARLPDYTITELHGGVASTRAEPASDSPLTLHPQSAIDWVLTPQRDVSEPVAVALLATSSTGESVFEARVEARISAQGVVRLRGPLREFIALGPGDWTITVLVGPPDGLPRDRAAFEADDDPTWQAVEISLTIAARP